VYYARCGETVVCGEQFLIVDRDYCTCPDFTCSLNHVGLQEGGTVVGWTDNGAGGIFGKYEFNPVEGSFPPEWENKFVPMGSDCTAAQVTHYRASDTPGVVTINCQVDDNMSYPEPDDPLSGPWANDDPAWSTKEFKITVYDLTITDPPINWLPRGGGEDNKVLFTAHLEPGVDHNGLALAGTIHFELADRSSEPGYCINDTSCEFGKDLTFVQADQQDEDPATEDGNCTILRPQIRRECL